MVGDFSRGRGVRGVRTTRRISAIFSSPATRGVGTSNGGGTGGGHVAAVVTNILTITLLIKAAVTIMGLVPRGGSSSNADSAVPRVRILAITRRRVRGLAIGGRGNDFMLGGRVRRSRSNSRRYI